MTSVNGHKTKAESISERSRNIESYGLSKTGSEEKVTVKKRRLGFYTGEQFYMADDFDETPECFKEYCTFE